VLLHDMQITDKTPPAERVAADLLLRDNLDASFVPPVRSRIMWAGVALATRCTMRPFGLAGIVLWALAALAGTYAIWSGLNGGTGWLVPVAILGPFVGALFWGRQYWAGVVAGYALWLIAVPGLVSYLGYIAYWVVEQTVRLGRKLFIPANKTEPLPGPPSYKAA
jgi:hypothetical protein